MGKVDPQFSPKVPVTNGARGIITFLFLSFYALVGAVRGQKEKNFASFCKNVCQESRDHVVAPFVAFWKFLKKKITTLRASKTKNLKTRKTRQKLTKVMSTKERASFMISDQKRAENLERAAQFVEDMPRKTTTWSFT